MDCWLRHILTDLEKMRDGHTRRLEARGYSAEMPPGLLDLITWVEKRLTEGGHDTLHSLQGVVTEKTRQATARQLGSMAPSPKIAAIKFIKQQVEQDVGRKVGLLAAKLYVEELQATMDRGKIQLPMHAPEDLLKELARLQRLGQHGRALRLLNMIYGVSVKDADIWLKAQQQRGVEGI